MSDFEDFEEANMEPIKLRTPIEEDGVEVTEVEVKELSMEQIENRSKAKSSIKKSFFMVSDATDLSMDAVRKLTAYDFNRISARVGEHGGLKEDDTED